MIISAIYGYSLLEVLISLLLVSLALFGLDAAQIYSLKESENVYFFSIAVQQLENAAERMIALQSRDGLAEQTALWNAENKHLLPLGFGTISGMYPTYELQICWQQTGEMKCLNRNIQLA